MRSFDTVVWVLQSAFTAAVVLAMVWVAIRRSQIPGTPIAVTQADGMIVPLGAIGGPATRWHVLIMESEVLRDGRLGVFEVANGQLSFTPKDAWEPEWIHPVRQLRAQHHERTFPGSTADLWLPDGQLLLIEVSRHKIYRFVRSDLASSTRPGEAHTFLRVLAANGATCSARPIWPSRP